MFSILFQPYPQRERTLKQSLVHSFLEGLFLYLFFVIFQPFGMSDWHSEDKYFQLVGFSVVTFLGTFTNRHLIPMLAPKFFEEKNWVLWKEILNIIILLSMISVGNWLYGSYLFHWKASFANFISSFMYVFIIGFFPIVFWVLADYIYKLKKYSKPVILTEATFYDKEKICLLAENEKDQFVLDGHDFYYIESADNYCTIYYNRDGNLTKHLFRSSLSRLENQLSSKEYIRTHRSYIVNLSKVASISGNAQGYKLHLNQFDLQIPVARKYSFVIENLRA
jgi:hypothetical protein